MADWLDVVLSVCTQITSNMMRRSSSRVDSRHSSHPTPSRGVGNSAGIGSRRHLIATRKSQPHGPAAQHALSGTTRCPVPPSRRGVCCGLPLLAWRPKISLSPSRFVNTDMLWTGREDTPKAPVRSDASKPRTAGRRTVFHTPHACGGPSNTLKLTASPSFGV